MWFCTLSTSTKTSCVSCVFLKSCFMSVKFVYVSMRETGSGSLVPCVCETVKREAWSTSPIMVMKEEEELHSIVKKCISTHYSHGAPRGKSTGAPLMHFSVISYSLLPLFLCFSFLSSYNCVTFPSPSIPSLNLPPPLSVCLFVYLPVCLLVCLSTPWLYLNRAALLRHSTWLLECRY